MNISNTAPVKFIAAGLLAVLATGIFAASINASTGSRQSELERTVLTAQATSSTTPAV